MTITIAGIKISDKYRAALELNKAGSFSALLYVASDEGRVTIAAENHYGRIGEDKACQRFKSQVDRWYGQVY